MSGYVSARTTEAAVPMPSLRDGSLEIEDKEVHLAMTKRDFKMSHSHVFHDLPESIYGVAMMGLVRSTQTYRGVVHGITAVIFGGLLLNIFAQVYVLICTKMYICDPAVLKVRHLYHHYESSVFPGGVFSQEGWDGFDRTEEICQVPLSQPAFFIAILAIWTGTCWVDLLESFTNISLWLGLPKCTGEQLTEVEEAEHLAKDMVEAENLDSVVLTAASSRIKAIAICFILIPKIVIAVLCWWLGARWLLATTCFQDLLLNGVALAFVTELDELIYMALIPDDIKEMVQDFKIAVPPKIVKSDSTRNQHEVDLLTFVSYRDWRLGFMIARMASTALVVVGLPVVYIRCLQQVLPGYRWDVHANCEGFIKAMTQGM